MAQDLSGKVIVITGGSSGIGAAAARALRQRGASVVITGRSDQTRRLADEIGAEAILADYKRLETVRDLAEQLLERYSRLDALVNNVGGVLHERHLTVDGFEATFQVNHLAGFLLTALLLDRLEASRSVVINTSSAGNNLGRVELTDLQNARGYRAMRAYGTAKLMNLLHAAELQRRYGERIQAASFHPGVVATGAGREGSALVKWFYGSVLGKWVMISPERGADTLLWLLEGRPGQDWKPGEYYADRRLGRRNPQAGDAELARGLWEASMQLVAPWLRSPAGR